MKSEAPDALEMTVVVQSKRTAQAPVDRGEAFLVMIHGDDLGKRFAISDRPIEVGRAAACDVTVDNESVSRKHARLWWAGQVYRIKDLGSTNGTYVNDVQVLERELADGDQIRIGRAIFKFMTGTNVEASYHEEVYRLKTLDGLTQIYNKTHFHEAFERDAARVKRYGGELGLVLFDVDHFKHKNDTFGHLAGDSILRELAQVVSQKVRRVDLFARVGGEEFAILTPEATMSGVKSVAEKVRAVVAAHVFRYEAHAISVTISAGVALWIGASDSPAAMYKRSDTALYKAKQSGRNQVAAS
jgi:diguanylate cyclase (GGDEF)-like protein